MLTVAEATAPSTLDPQASDLAADRFAWDLSYQCLMNTTASGKIVPELATSYSVGSKGLTYTFNLRDGVHFQDGSLLTASDVVYTFNRLFTSGSPSLRAIFPTYKSVKALSASQVQFTLSSPDAGFVDDMASPLVYGCAILSQKSGALGSLATHLDGTGPWQQVSYSPQSELKLTQFGGYWGPKTKMKNLNVLYVPESTTQVTDLEAGSVSMIFPPESAAQSLAGQQSLQVTNVPSDVTVFLDINNQVAPFNNPLVRQALAVAVDRSSLAQVAYVGAAVPSAYVPPTYTWAAQLGSLPFSQYNPGKAKQLLAQAGYPHGVNITLKYIDNYDPGTNGLMDQMQSELNAVGIHTTLDPLQTAAWLAQTNTNADYQLSWNEQTYYSDPYLYAAVPDYRLGPGKGTLPPGLAALTGKVLQANSPGAYQQAITAVETWEAQNVYPTITLLALKQYVAYQKNLAGVNLPPSGSRQFLANVGA
jgi:ABC-type transport system substrate-binding protein